MSTAEKHPDSDATSMLSAFLCPFGKAGGKACLVRIYPTVVGEGIVSLPEGRLQIGRGDDCDLVLSDKDVSRHHAAIEFRNGDYFVSDLGSTNGTQVNDQKADSRPLRSGDLLQLGKNILKFLRGDDLEKQYHETVYKMMITDGLTGIPNKRFFLDALERELARAQRHGRPLSLAMFDIDHFKGINDKYGHLAGDAVLRELARRVTETLRSDELFARYGGEEFALVMPETSRDDAARLGERVRATVQQSSFPVAELQIPVTISIGIATAEGDKLGAPQTLIDRADQKLYDAKRGGRNRVVS